MSGGIGSGGIVSVFLPPGGTAGQAVVKVDGQDYNFTFGAGGGGGGIGTLSDTAGNTATGPAVQFGTSPTITFGVVGNTITAVANVTAAPSPVNVTGANGSSVNAQTIAFSNANGLSLGVSTGANGATVTGSYTVPPAQTQFVLSNSNGISFGTVGSTVTASYTTPSTAGLLSAVNVSAGTTSSNLSAVTFGNANNVSFGLQGGTVTASASQSSASFSNANGVSFGIAGSTVTATVATNYMASNQSSNFAATGFTTTTTAGSLVAGTHDTAGLKLAVPAYLTTTPSLANYFSNTGTTFNGANVSGSMTLNTNGLQLSLSAAAGGGGGVATATNYYTGNTTQSSSGTMALSSQIFVGYGIVSVGQSNGSVLISSPNPVTATDMSIGISGGNTAGNTGTVANGQVVFAGGNNITLSGSTNGSSMTITISGGAGGGGGGGIGMGVSTMGNTAGTTGTVTTGNVILVGSGPISLSQSSSGSNATISINAPATSSLVGGANITVSTNGSTISIIGASVAAAPIGISAGTVTNTYQTITLSNSNNVSFGLGTGASAGVITASASYPAQTVQPVAVSGSNGSFSYSTLTMGALNGLSFYTSNGSMVGSYTVPTQSNQTGAVYASSQTYGQSSSSTYDARSLSLVGSGGVSVGWSGGSLMVSGQTTTPQTVQPVAVSGSNGSFAFSTLTMGNLNGLSHYTSNGSLVASYTVPTVTNSSFSAGVSTGGNTSGNTGMQTGQLVFAGGNNITLSVGTAAGGNQTITISGPNVGGAQTGISGLQVSNTTYTSGTVTFQNANGISFGSSGVNGISASYTVPTVTNSSWTVSDAATSATVGRLAFTNSNNVTMTLSTSNNGNHTLIASIPAGATATGNFGAAAAGTQTATSGTVNWANSNGISFGMSGSSQITASYTVPSTAGLISGTFSAYAQSNTTQSSSGTMPYSSLMFAGAGVASVGVSNGSVVVSVPAGGGGITNINVSAGTTSQNLSNLVFANSNGVSFGLNGSTITASAAGGGGNFSGGVSTAGNTAGATGISGTQMVLVGSGVVSLSQTTGANGNTVSILAPATSVLTGVNGISISTNGSTISVSAIQYTQSLWQPEVWGATLTTSHANGTVYMRPFELANYQNYNKLMLQQSFASSASTMSVSGSVSAGNASSGTGTWGQTNTVLMFSRVQTNKTAASYNSIVTFDSKTVSASAGYSLSASWSTNASSATVSWTTSAAVGFISQIDSAGGITYGTTSSSASSTFSSTSTNANSISSSYVMSFPYAHMSGIRPMWVPGSGTNMPPGEYWVGVIQSTQTGSTNYSLQRVAMMSNPGIVYFTGSSNNSYLEIGSSANIASSNTRAGFGSYSASSNTTANIPLTAVTSMASNASMYVAIMGQTK